jgi:hypothetical protein
MRGATAPEPESGSAELKLELVGPAGALALLESELVWALAGKASIAARNGTIIRLRKCLEETTRHMSWTLLRETDALSGSYRLSALNRLIWINAGRLAGQIPPNRVLFTPKREILFAMEGAALVDRPTPTWTINLFESAVLQQRRIKISYLPAMCLDFMAHRPEAGEGRHSALGRQCRSRPDRS